MQKEAVLLKPGQRLEGTIEMDSSLFGRLKPGEYPLECTLVGWKEDKFTPAQYSELAKMGAPFMCGEVPASTRITLYRDILCLVDPIVGVIAIRQMTIPTGNRGRTLIIRLGAKALPASARTPVSKIDMRIAD
jgi:hypothetical protein